MAKKKDEHKQETGAGPPPGRPLRYIPTPF